MDLVMYKALFSLIIVRVFLTTYAQTYSDMDTLLNHLFNESRYNKRLRPLRNQSHVIKVNFTQYLNSIEYFDITTGELLITGFFQITWTDELLTWDPSLYGGKDNISLPKEAFWKPELSITNGPPNDDSSIYNSGFFPTWASYQGSVLMIPAGSYQTRCNVDTTLYPYDIHNCNFQFIVSNYDSAELMLLSPIGDIHTKELKENGEWEIKDTRVEVVLLKEETIGKLSIPMIQTSFSLKRRPTFELINIYTPISLISCLNMVTCFVRPESGERLTFAVTLYLSLVFSSTAAIARIPNNSLKMPFISYQVLCINVINTVGVIWSIFIVHFANKSIKERQLPHFVVKMVMKNRQTETGKLKVYRNGKLEVATDSTEDHKDDNFSDGYKVEDEQELELIPRHEVAAVLDRLYFWLVFMILLILNSLSSAIMFKIWTV